MSEQRTIRTLGESDVGALQQIDRIAHGAPWSQRTFMLEISEPNRVHLVAEVDDVVIGHAAAWIDGRSCRITNVAVDQDHAGAGHATALVAALLQKSIEHHRVANAQLEVRPRNRRAQRLYSRFGFFPVGVERGFYDRSDDNGSRDAVVMAVTDVCADQWRSRLHQIASEYETTR